MLPGRQKDTKSLHRIRVEIHKPRRLRFDQLRMQQLAVHPESKQHRLAANPFSRQPNLDRVLRIPLDTLQSLDQRRRNPADLLVLAVQFNFDRLLRQRVEAQCPRRNLLRRIQILLHQHRRDRQHIPDVVKTKTGIVCRKILIRAKIHLQQIANRVRVFRPVQPPRRHPTRIRLDLRIRLLKLGVNVMEQPVDLRLCWPRKSLRRHLPGFDLADNPLPVVAIFPQRPRIRERRDIDTPRRIPLVMAGSTRFKQHGLHRAGKILRLGRHNSKADRSQTKVSDHHYHLIECSAHLLCFQSIPPKCTWGMQGTT